MKCMDQMPPPIAMAPLSSDFGEKNSEGASYPNVSAKPVKDAIIATKIDSITKVGSYTMDMRRSWAPRPCIRREQPCTKTRRRKCSSFGFTRAGNKGVLEPFLRQKATVVFAEVFVLGAVSR